MVRPGREYGELLQGSALDRDAPAHAPRKALCSAVFVYGETVQVPQL